MKTVAILFVLVFASTGYAQYDDPPPTVPGTQERLARLEKDQRAITSKQARMESDIADSKEALRLIADKLDAMAKAQGGSFASTKVWDGQAISFSSGAAAQPVGYSSAVSSSMRTRFLSRPIIRRAGGACAN